MRIRLAIPNNIVSPEVLNAVLEASTLANAKLLQHGEAPTVSEAIKRGLKWRPEPYTDGEHFDLAPVAAGRGWGDCDDLAPWLAAEMRLRGDPDATAIVKKSGPRRWHVIVRDGQGQLHDPSRWAGMGQPKGARAAIHGVMTPPGQGSLALLPVGRQWAARCDLPWGAQHVSGLAICGDIEDAAIQAARGASLVGDEMGLDLDGFEHLIAGLCGDVDGEDGEEVGAFLDTLGNLATAVAPAAAFIPGVGPIAAAALPMAGSLLKGLGSGGGGGGGPSSSVPAMPLPPLPPSPAAPAGVPGMAALPLPGGGQIAFKPSSSNQPGPIIVRF